MYMHAHPAGCCSHRPCLCWPAPQVLEEGRNHASTFLGTPLYLSPEMCNVRFASQQHCSDEGMPHSNCSMRALHAGRMSACRHLCVRLSVLPSCFTNGTAVQELPYDAKSDIWAVGVVLYECAMRRHPFEAKSQVRPGGQRSWGSC